MPSRASASTAGGGAPITGPSFLGLSSGSYAADPSYLLDDDESSSHIGLWIFLILLVAAAGTGFHFRNELRPRALQAYAAVQERINLQPEAPAQAPATTPQLDKPADPPTIGTESSKPADTEATDKTGAEVPKIAAEPAKPYEADEHSVATKSTEPEKPAAALRNDHDRDEETETAPARKAVGRPSSAKPRTAKPAPEDDRSLQLARRYIHGQGVPRNCEQGLLYLREAVRHSNPDAASQMGALYATGTCVPQDRVEAYRWFSAALQLSPENSLLSRERDELYGQMTSAERHQADRR